MIYLNQKKQYKKRQTKQEIIDEYKGGFIDEPTYEPVYKMILQVSMNLLSLKKTTS